MDHPDLESANLSSLRTLIHIGASAPPALRLRARQRFGRRIDRSSGLSPRVAAEYGQTVTTSLLLLPRDTIPLTSQGKPDREAIRALGRAGGTSSTVGKTAC
jgi:acyl-CoA synthetase (AMP-forming)/AMP-acid ligase II